MRSRLDLGSLSWVQIVGQVLAAGSLTAVLSWLVTAEVSVDIVVVVVLVHGGYLLSTKWRK